MYVVAAVKATGKIYLETLKVYTLELLRLGFMRLWKFLNLSLCVQILQVTASVDMC